MLIEFVDFGPHKVFLLQSLKPEKWHLGLSSGRRKVSIETSGRYRARVYSSLPPARSYLVYACLSVF